MKKIFVLFLALLISFTICSCEEYYDDYDSPNITTTYLDEDGSFTLNDCKYNKVILDSFEYLIYFDDFVQYEDFYLRVEGGDSGIYPYLLIDDKEMKMFYLYSTYSYYSEFYNQPYKSYNLMYLKDGETLPHESALVTKVTLKINKDQQMDFEFNKEELNSLFTECDNIAFIWQEDEEDKVYVDAYIGYAYISFYSENYQDDFLIIAKVYQDKENNYYTKLDSWYKFNFPVLNNE